MKRTYKIIGLSLLLFLILVAAKIRLDQIDTTTWLWSTFQTDGTLNGVANEVSTFNWLGFSISGTGATRTITNRFGPEQYTTNIKGIGFPGTITSANTTLAVLADGRLSLTSVYLRKGDVITDISYASDPTAAALPLNWWFALYDSSRNLIRQTADQTTTAWAANTTKTLALSSTYTVASTGIYYAGIMMNIDTGGTLVGLRGTSVSAALMNLITPLPNGSSTTGLTTTAPDPAAALTSTNNTPIIILR